MAVKLLSGGAAQGLLAALAQQIEVMAGGPIDAQFGAVGAMRDKLAAGVAADLVILTREAIDALGHDGLVVKGSAVDIGVVLTGVAIRSGDPLPPVASAVELRSALKAASTIHFPDPQLATAGIHFTKVLRQLGIAADVADRCRTHPNGASAMAAMAQDGGVARHQGAPIGCTQITEIVATPGVVLVGPLPHEFELATVYTAAVTTRSTQAKTATLITELLAATDAAPERRRVGMIDMN